MPTGREMVVRLRECMFFLDKSVLRNFKNMNDVKIFYYEQLDNTINQSERLIKNNEPAPFAVICNGQSNGVASHPNKSWDSPMNAGNIHLTLVCPLRNLPVPPSGGSILGILSDFSNKILDKITNYLNIKAGSDLIYSNRNDVFCNQLKMGGAMCSSDLNLGVVTYSIGLNVNSTNKDFRIDLQDKITTLRDATNKSYDLKEMTREIIKIVIDS